MRGDRQACGKRGRKARAKKKKWRMSLRAFVFGVLLCGCFSTGFLPAQESQPENRLQLARRYASSGETAKALSLYEELYRQNPQPFIYESYLECLQATGQYEQAEKLIRRQMRLSPVPVLLRVDLAQNFLLQDQKGKAEDLLEEIARKTDFSQPGLSVEELAEKVVEKTRMYDPAIEIYLQARRQAETGGLENGRNSGRVGSRKNNRVSAAGTGRGEVPDASSLLMEPAGSAGGPGPFRSKAPAERPYASQLANLYRLEGRYAPMLDEYIALLRSRPSAREEVYARLQALLSGAGMEHSAQRKVSQELLQIVSRKAQEAANDREVQSLLVWMLLQEKEYASAIDQARACSQRFGDGGAKWHETIRTVAGNQAYDLAQARYEELLRQASFPQAGIHPSVARACRIELLNLYFSRIESRKLRDTARIEEIKQAYKQLFSVLGRDPETFTMYRNLARIYAYYTHEEDSARLLLGQALSNPGFSPLQKARLKIDLADILLYGGKVWDATLLYSQVEKDFKQDAIGFYAKLQNARLSYYIGEFEWAKSQLDVLRAATSKLIANDAMELSLLIRESMNPDSSYEGLALVAEADLLIFRNLYEPALALLDQVLSMPMEGALFDEAYMRKARIFLQQDSVEACLENLARIYDGSREGLLADDALFMAAGLLQLRSGMPIDPETEFLQAADFPAPGSPAWGRRTEQEKQGDKEKAMALYLRLFTEHKSSALAPLARQRYRQLRGG